MLSLKPCTWLLYPYSFALLLDIILTSYLSWTFFLHSMMCCVSTPVSWPGSMLSGAYVDSRLWIITVTYSKCSESLHSDCYRVAQGIHLQAFSCVQRWSRLSSLPVVWLERPEEDQCVSWVYSSELGSSTDRKWLPSSTPAFKCAPVFYSLNYEEQLIRCKDFPITFCY